MKLAIEAITKALRENVDASVIDLDGHKIHRIALSEGETLAESDQYDQVEISLDEESEDKVSVLVVAEGNELDEAAVALAEKFEKKDKDKDDESDDDEDDDKDSDEEDDVEVKEDVTTDEWKARIVETATNELTARGADKTVAKIEARKIHKAVVAEMATDEAGSEFEDALTESIDKAVTAALTEMGIKPMAFEFTAKGEDFKVVSEELKAAGLDVKVDEDIALFRFDEDDKDAVEAIFESRVTNIDNHIVEDSGKSFYRVMNEAGFDDEQMTAISTLFEAAVNERVEAERAEDQADIERQVDEAVDAMVKALDETVAQSVGEWVTANEADVLSEIKVNKAEKLIEGLKTVLAEAGVEIPESEVSELRDSADSLKESESRVAELEAQIAELNEKIEDTTRSTVLAEVSAERDLTLSQKSKLKRLSEALDFDDGFEAKVRTIAESHFSGSRSQDRSKAVEDGEANDVITESAVQSAPPAQVNPVVQTLRRGNRNVSFG